MLQNIQKYIILWITQTCSIQVNHLEINQKINFELENIIHWANEIPLNTKKT